MDDSIDDQDLLIYLAFGAALVYFLYKNNVFGAPSGAPPPSSSPALLPAPASSSSASAAQSNAGASDFGITDPNAPW